MARNEVIEQRLREWAQWLKVGDGSGYPTKCTLHPEWSPPSAGITPTMKVGAPSSARQTHRAVEVLSVRMRNTLVLHYVLGLSIDDCAARLGCQAPAIYPRIWRAHRLLLVSLGGGQ